MSFDDEMIAFKKLTPIDEGLSSADRAEVITSAVFDFICLHLDMEQVDHCPTNYSELREHLTSSGANFGRPPTEEEFHSPEYVHEPFVPETYSELRDIVLSTYSELCNTHFDMQKAYEVISAIEAALPADESAFMAKLRVCKYTRNRAIIFALEELGKGKFSASPAGNDPVEALLAALQNTRPE